jgi:nucleoside 2-deoxyribosyltransferase
LEERGLRVYLAPREEEWGARRPDRHVGIKRDLRAIREAGVFVLFLDGNDSDGALVEFGMAVSLGKFILVIARQGEAVRGYLRGMLDLGLAELFYLSNDEIGNFVVRIEKAMRMALEGA